jgi:hypothetical protein
LRDQVTSDLAENAKVDPMHVYLDVPTTPSVPYTSSREAPTHIRLAHREGRRMVSRNVPISELPLVGSIAGFMDVLRDTAMVASIVRMGFSSYPLTIRGVMKRSSSPR